MKKPLKTLLFILTISFSVHGQSLIFQNLEPSVAVQETPEKLQITLDSASNLARIPLHAKFYNHLLSWQDAVAEGRNYFWKLPAENFVMRVYLMPDLEVNDSLIIYSIDGKIIERLSGEEPLLDYWISQPSTNGAIVRYKSHSSRPPSTRILGYSLGNAKANKKGVFDFGDAGSCEVNIACAEGDNYRDEERSVVRINVKLAGFEGWCTGTLINNTAQDFKPYILTAEHCGLLGSSFAAPTDLARWEFYFNYQGVNCSNPASEAQLNFRRITGSELIARSNDNGGDFGSDFALVHLSDTIAFNALSNPYFAGWDRSNSAPPSGVTIHHPEGDIKKISTFSRSENSEFGSSVSDTHWKVWWDPTTTNHGVTEKGSSGCPLFNDLGLYTGGLTGGNASCNNRSAPDWFGKFSYSWDQNGTNSNRRLAPWLDPNGSGDFVFSGAFRGDSLLPGPTAGELELAPNPVTQGIIKVWNMSSNEIADVYVFDVTGNLVFQKEKLTGLPGSLGLPVLDLSRLNNGLYIVRLVPQTSATQNIKILIQQ